jgi:hypothetical protein
MVLSKNDFYTTVLNTIMHMLILWVFLTVFFFYYITEMSKEALQSELGKYIDTDFKNSLNNLSFEQQIKAKLLLQNLPLDNMINLYSNPDERVVINNKWVLITACIISISLLLLFFGIAFILKTQRDTNVSLGHIFKENAITFFFVGIIEFVFFTRIAAKYVPVLPSVATRAMVKRLQKNFN